MIKRKVLLNLDHEYCSQVHRTTEKTYNGQIICDTGTT